MKNILFFVLLLPNVVFSQDISTFASGIYDPNGLAFDFNGNLYVANSLGCKILKIDTSGFVSTFAGNGTAGFNGDSILATNAMLNQPGGIAIDISGNVIFADDGNNRIRKIDILTGIITTIVGNGTGGYFGDNGSALNAELNHPVLICFDNFWNLYITEYSNYRIRKVNSEGIITTVAGNGLFGTSTGNGGPATAARCAPHGICVDKYKNLYFTQFGSGLETIRKIDSYGIISTIAGDSNLATYNGDGILAINAHMDPYGIIINSNGMIFISDLGNNRIRVIDSNGIIYTVAGNGIAGFSGDGTNADSAKLYYPSGLTFDHCGNLYISDIGNERIRKVSFNPTCNLSVQEVTTKTEVTIYPNPAAEEITISGVKADVKWCLFNIKSIIEQQGILKAGSNTLSIETLSPGLYILELTMDDGTRIMKKIIKL